MIKNPVCLSPQEIAIPLPVLIFFDETLYPLGLPEIFRKNFSYLMDQTFKMTDFIEDLRNNQKFWLFLIKEAFKQIFRQSFVRH